MSLSGGSDRATGARGSTFLVAGLVGLATLLAYLPALRNGFVTWDDGTLVRDNLHIRSLDTGFFRWAFLSFHASNWHPLTWLSHALDYAIWGLDPFGHHLTSVLLHGANAFLAAVVAAALLRAAGKPSMAAAGIAGLLFGLHPTHVESVAWVSERKDVLCALLYLASIAGYLRYVGGAGVRRGRYACCLGLFALSLLSKPMAVTLPLVLLLLDWYPLARFDAAGRWKSILAEKIPFFALAGASAVITLLGQHCAAAPLASLPLLARMAVALRALVSYLFKMLWPADLIPFYPYPRRIFLLSADYLVPFALALAITGAFVVFSARQKFWLAVWAYYVVTILPVLGIVQVGSQSMADRYTYLPSIGPFLAAGLGASVVFYKLFLPGRWNVAAKVCLACLALGLLGFLSYLTGGQIQIWKNGITLWSRVIEVEPLKDATPYQNRAVAFLEAGLFEKAAEDYSQAIQLSPDTPESYHGRAIARMNLGRLEDALGDYTRAIQLSPLPVLELYRDRAMLYTMLGRDEEAEADLAQAERLRVVGKAGKQPDQKQGTSR